MQLDQYRLNFSHGANAFALKGVASLNRVNKTAFQDTANDNYSSAFRDEKMKGTYTWGGDLQGTVNPATWAEMTFGLALKEVVWKYNEDYPGSTRDAGAEGRQRTISPFFNLDLRFLEDSLIVNLGGRYDWIETSDGLNFDTQAGAGKPAYNNKYDTTTENSFSPKLGIAFHPDDKTTLRASGGRGFRAPSLFELYKVHVRQGGSYYREANPNLKSEEIWSYDVGAERYLLDNLWAKVGFYQSWARDYAGQNMANRERLLWPTNP